MNTRLRAVASTFFSLALALLALGDPNARAGVLSACNGLTPVGNDLVWDPANQVYWLADANLGARSRFNVPSITPDGSMSFSTAQGWVKALREANHLGLGNWQLPVTPPRDKTCAVLKGRDGNSFGPGCTRSALGHLYKLGLGLAFPNSVVAAGVKNTIGPFQNLQPSLYWTSDKKGGSGEVTFSFGTNQHFANTTRFNYMHVLAMVPGWIHQKPTGQGLVAYTSGPAAGKAVYDSDANAPNGITWLLDANLGARNKLGLDGNTTIAERGKRTLSVPLVASSGTMLFSTAKQWVQGLRTTKFAGSEKWQLPSLADLTTLFGHLQLKGGDPRLLAKGNVGPFRNFQPFFYWSCERDQSGTSQSTCNGHTAGHHNGVAMEFSFNFDSGFQGTDQNTKKMFVLPYSPGSPPPQCGSQTCSTPQECCLQAGGYWNGRQCE